MAALPAYACLKNEFTEDEKYHNLISLLILRLPFIINPEEIGQKEHQIFLLHDKTNKMTYAPSDDYDQPWHPPSLIGVSTVRMKKNWVFSYP